MADNMAQLYSSMPPEDKAALKALKAEEEARVGKIVSISDMIKAVTPGLPDPSYLV